VLFDALARYARGLGAAEWGEGAMHELPLTWPRVARIWWLMAWRITVGAVILGFVFGGIAGGVTGGIEGALGATRETMLWSTKLAGQVAGFIASLIWLFFVLRMALRKRYSDFRLALIVDNSN
jgi:hypothetical protein